METQNRENIGMDNAPSDLKEFASLYDIGEKVSLEKLINLMQEARDAEVTGVSFSFGPKRRYNLSIPHRATDGTVLEVIRIANVKEGFIGPVNPNDYLYNDKVAVANRETNYSARKRETLLGESLCIAVKALEHAIDKTEASDLHDYLCNAVEEIKLWSEERQLPPRVTIHHSIVQTSKHSNHHHVWLQVGEDTLTGEGADYENALTDLERQIEAQDCPFILAIIKK